MPDWPPKGLSARLVARLAAAGVTDDNALRDWREANPNGIGTIGRVMLAEIDNYLAALPPES
jgi:hypothetical protein